MKWKEFPETPPPKDEYVLIWIEGYIGISKYDEENGEWDTGSWNRRPMFKPDDYTRMKIDAEYWMPLPMPPKEEK